MSKKIVLSIAVALALLAGCGPAAPTATAVPPAATGEPTPLPQPTIPPTPVPTASPTSPPTVGTVVLIFGQGFVYGLYNTVRLTLEMANYRVVIASDTLDPLRPNGGGEPVQPDLLVTDLRVADYDAVVFTCDDDFAYGGGRPETDHIAQEAVAQDKVLGAICNAPLELGQAGVLQGRKATGEPSRTCGRLETDFGATCTGAVVERDGLIITARDRYASNVFAQAIIKAVQEQATAPPTGDTWIRSYQDQITGTLSDGVPTADGGYLLVGSTHYTHYNEDNEDLYLLQIDAAGEPLWQKILGGERFDRGNHIVPAAGGGFLIFGETRSRGAGDRDLYLLQIDATGNVLWERTFGGPAEETGEAIYPTADGGIILVGVTASFGAGGTDMYLVKTDSQGNEEWSQTYGSELDEEGYAVVELPDGGLLVLGALMHEGRDYVAQNPDVYLVRTDGLGHPLWSRVLEQPGAQGGHRILPAADGTFLIFGIRSDASGSAELDPLLLAVDADGNVLWEGAIGEAGVSDYTSGVLPTADGGYLQTGMSLRGSRGSIPLYKIDAAGQLLWRKTLFEQRGNQAGIAIVESPAGGHLVIGTISDGGRGWYTLLIKTDDEGNVSGASSSRDDRRGGFLCLYDAPALSS